MDEQAELPRDTEVIADRQDLVDALVRAIVEGDAATSQHIVDTLGDRAQERHGQHPPQ